MGIKMMPIQPLWGTAARVYRINIGGVRTYAVACCGRWALRRHLEGVEVQTMGVHLFPTYREAKHYLLEV